MGCQDQLDTSNRTPYGHPPQQDGLATTRISLSQLHKMIAS